MTRPRLRLRGPVLDAATDEALAVAGFYERLLGWAITDSHPAGWAMVQSPDGLLKIEIQGSRDYRRPVWPSRTDEQQMMVHVDFATDDVEAAVAWALELGATLAEHQPQHDVRVLLDPAGHPFCLFDGPV